MATVPVGLNLETVLKVTRFVWTLVPAGNPSPSLYGLRLFFVAVAWFAEVLVMEFHVFFSRGDQSWEVFVDEL